MTVAPYVQLTRRGHPVATASGLVMAHRVVLYDAIGPGPHRCHWCQREVAWFAPAPRTLVVDHLDSDGHNNDRSNLVASCNRCNVWRGHWPESFKWNVLLSAQDRMNAAYEAICRLPEPLEAS